MYLQGVGSSSYYPSHSLPSQSPSPPPQPTSSQSFGGARSRIRGARYNVQEQTVDLVSFRSAPGTLTRTSGNRSSGRAGRQDLDGIELSQLGAVGGRPQQADDPAVLLPQPMEEMTVRYNPLEGAQIQTQAQIHQQPHLLQGQRPALPGNLRDELLRAQLMGQ